MLILTFSARFAGAADRIVPESLIQRSTGEKTVRVVVELGGVLPRSEAGVDPMTVAARRRDIASAQNVVLERLRGLPHQLMRRFETVPFLALEVGVDALRALDVMPGLVVRLREDSLARPALVESTAIVEAIDAWSLGFDGSGTVIAVIDNGVESSHPVLAGKVIEEACFSTRCPNGSTSQTGAGAAAPCTSDALQCSHGTGSAGVAAGDGFAAGVPVAGVARAAKIMAVNVVSNLTGSDCTAHGLPSPCLGIRTSDSIAALERVYLLRNAYNFAAVLIATASGRFTGNCDSEPEKPIIDNLRAVGIPTIVASGNSGFTNATASPACVSTAVSVGSTDDGSLGTTADAVSPFSNSAAFLTLLAPGRWITQPVLGGQLAVAAGTSDSAAHVAGAFAILKDAAPDATVDERIAALVDSGVPIVDPRNGITKPRIQILEAIARLVTPANDNFASAEPIAGLTGSREGSNVGGSREPGEPSHAEVPGRASVWYRWTAPSNGFATFDTHGSDFDTLLAAYVGAGLVSLTPVAGNDDTAGGLTSEVSFSVSAGTVYWIAVDGAENEIGRLTLNWRLSPSGNPAPGLATLSPSSKLVGSAMFTLTVTGTNFVANPAGSVVRWNGADRETTFVSSTELRATIQAADLATATAAAVTVFNPAPGGGTSNPVTFTVTNPVPHITSLSQTSVAAGAPTTFVTIVGTGFISTSAVRWNGASNPDLSIQSSGRTSTQFTVRLFPRLLETAGTNKITVVNPAPGGGTSEEVTFTIDPAPAPVALRLVPDRLPAGSQGVNLKVEGSGFSSNSVVRWNGENLISVMSGARDVMNGLVLARHLATPGTATVTVFTPGPPGGGESAPLTFFIDGPADNPVPTLTKLTPDTKTAGDPAFTLTVDGTNFASTAVVRWMGRDLTPSSRTSTRLVVSIPASDILTPGPVDVQVFNPAPGGGLSNSLPFTVLAENPVPELIELRPSTATAGTSGVNPLVVIGRNFVNQSKIYWNGSPRSTTFISSSELRAFIPATDIAGPGSVDVHVVSPLPGGGPSNALPFVIAPRGADLVAEFVGVPPALVVPGERFAIEDIVRNVGSAAAGPSKARYYLSLDQVKTLGDVLLTTRSIASLPAGGTDQGEPNMTVPSFAQPGTYFLLACADDSTQVAEVDETNNCRPAPSPIVVTLPDLTITEVSDPPGAAAPGTPFPATTAIKIKNQGGVPAQKSLTRFYLSRGILKGADDLPLTKTLPAPSLAPGEEVPLPVNLTVPANAAAGTYFLLACADDQRAARETDESNNCRASAGQILVARPDLTIAAVSNPPATLAPGATFSVLDTAENRGTLSVGPSTTRYYLSLDPVRGPGDRILTGTRIVPALTPGEPSEGRVDVIVSTGTPAGVYFLVACADDLGRAPEDDEANNCRASATTVEIRRATSIFVSLTVTPTGPGSGLVTSSDTRILCGTLCSGAYAVNAAVTLRAMPQPGSLFEGWGGACAGLSACTVRLTEAKVVEARFALAQGTIQVFTEKAPFLGTTCATSATGPYPNLGKVLTPIRVGSVTFTAANDFSPRIVIGTAGLGSQVANNDWTLLIPGHDLAISGHEDLDVRFDAPVTAMGFDFVEANHEPNRGGRTAPFVDSTFMVTLKNGASTINWFTFNAPEDTLAFVGVASTVAFDRIEIRERERAVDDEYFGEIYTSSGCP